MEQLELFHIEPIQPIANNNLIEIEGFKGYFVSKVGDVFILKEDTLDKMKSRIERNGYARIGICHNGKQYQKSVHRLVASAFIPNPDRLPQINHKNENKLDNRVENLEWCTAKYNANYGTRIYKIKKNNRGKTREKEVAKCDMGGCILKVYASISEAVKDSHNRAHIIDCCKNRRNKHHGYKWKYV